MIDYNFWYLFISVAIALNVAPGPDVLYILTKTISGGKRIGFASSLGVCTGALFHVIISAIGLSAILYTSAIAFTLVKYVGAAYLLYLAFHAFSSSGLIIDKTVSKTTKDHKPASIWSAFKQGVLIDILNPKVAIFFMAFLPQFVRQGHGSTTFQLMMFGIIIIILAIFIELIYVLLADSIANKFRNDKRYSMWMDRVVGVVFLGLGLKLAVSTNS